MKIPVIHEGHAFTNVQLACLSIAVKVLYDLNENISIDLHFFKIDASNAIEIRVSFCNIWLHLDHFDIIYGDKISISEIYDFDSDEEMINNFQIKLKKVCDLKS